MAHHSQFSGSDGLRGVGLSPGPVPGRGMWTAEEARVPWHASAMDHPRAVSLARCAFRSTLAARPSVEPSPRRCLGLEMRWGPSLAGRRAHAPGIAA